MVSAYTGNEDCVPWSVWIGIVTSASQLCWDDAWKRFRSATSWIVKSRLPEMKRMWSEKSPRWSCVFYICNGTDSPLGQQTKCLTNYLILLGLGSSDSLYKIFHRSFIGNYWCNCWLKDIKSWIGQRIQLQIRLEDGRSDVLESPRVEVCLLLLQKQLISPTAILLKKKVFME